MLAVSGNAQLMPALGTQAQDVIAEVACRVRGVSSAAEHLVAGSESGGVGSLGADGENGERDGVGPPLIVAGGRGCHVDRSATKVVEQPGDGAGVGDERVALLIVAVAAREGLNEDRLRRRWHSQGRRGLCRMPSKRALAVSTLAAWVVTRTLNHGRAKVASTPLSTLVVPSHAGWSRHRVRAPGQPSAKPRPYRLVRRVKCR